MSVIIGVSEHKASKDAVRFALDLYESTDKKLYFVNVTPTQSPDEVEVLKETKEIVKNHTFDGDYVTETLYLDEYGDSEKGAALSIYKLAVELNVGHIILGDTNKKSTLFTKTATDVLDKKMKGGQLTLVKSY